jgi:hypothetical protein
MSDFEFKESKPIRNLRVGDCISVSGYSKDAAEIEEIRPISTCLMVTLSNGDAKLFNSTDFDKLIRCYKI